MPTYRTKKNRNYTVMGNVHLRDPALSLKAKGLLSIALSFPDDHVFSVTAFVGLTRDGRDAVMSTLDELEKAGYLARTAKGERDATGHFTPADYEFIEAPPEAADRVGKSDADRVGKSDADRVGKSDTDRVGKSDTDRVGKSDTDTLLKKNTKYIPPHNPPQGGKRARVRKYVPVYEPEAFEGFWLFYPKVGRKDRKLAVEQWDRLRPDLPTMWRMRRALEWLAKYDEQWKRAVGVPYAGRWIRDQRWEEVDPEDGPTDGEEDRRIW